MLEDLFGEIGSGHLYRMGGGEDYKCDFLSEILFSNSIANSLSYYSFYGYNVPVPVSVLVISFSA
jgi:hypothetical protein